MDPQIEDVRIRAFRPGDVIFRQGDPARREVYLVHEGMVEVRSRINGEEGFFRILRHGDLLGEVAFFREGAHSATAVALEVVLLLVIPADRLERIVRTNPELAIALIRQLARMAAREDDSAAHGQ
jgi:CRP/FNR family cyclic AMP-dependent transcriptional regulator